MEHQDKIDWMIKWAFKNDVKLDLNGECGIGRDCVGILAKNDCFPDYEQWDGEWDGADWDDYGGDDEYIWIPKDAYHKHPCVAVLGTGENAESQLYDWLKWFDDNGFTVVVTDSGKQNLEMIELLMGKDRNARMVKKVN